MELILEMKKGLVSRSEPRGGSESLLEEIRNHVSNMELSELIWRTC